MPQERRPANLLYTVDENPPAGLNLMLSLQHLALGLMYTLQLHKILYSNLVVAMKSTASIS